MEDQRKQEADLRDEDEAAQERPIPSQAEGDLETIEEDLKQKEKQAGQGRVSFSKREKGRP
jgi:hypothetical protein